MDTKNIIAAISLSAAVIILWALFFGPSTEEIKQNKINQEQVKQEQT
jgi:YidC/Oxa1 family membrane protein insertase